MRSRAPWCRSQSCPRARAPQRSVRGRSTSNDVLRVLPASMRSHEINQGQQRHPDDVECVPEQAETEQPAAHEVARAPHRGLRHQENEPYETDGNVRAVQTDETEEGREEGA